MVRRWQKCLIDRMGGGRRGLVHRKTQKPVFFLLPRNLDYNGVWKVGILIVRVFWRRRK